MAFNPKEHITKMGNREYLEVKWRIVWFREEFPQGRIETEPFTVGDMVYIKAIITNNEGGIIASGLATVRDASQREATWAGRVIEKAETAAIGRALAHAGFGTQFTDEDEGDNLADSPIERSRKPAAPNKLEPEAHFDGAWNEAEIKKFWARWNGKEKIASETILKALRVNKLSEWNQSLANANVAMQQYINTIK